MRYPAEFPKMTAESTRDPVPATAASRPYDPYCPELTHPWDAPPSKGGVSHGIPPTFEDIFRRHSLPQSHVKEGLDTYVSTLEKEIRDLVDEARYLSNISNVLRAARDSMKARVVSTTSSYRRWGVPNYTKVEDNNSEPEERMPLSRARGSIFSVYCDVPPNGSPFTKQLWAYWQS